jgi:hypothetical protein
MALQHRKDATKLYWLAGVVIKLNVLSTRDDVKGPAPRNI